jgi:uncharacterized protein (UPF0335 family)
MNVEDKLVERATQDFIPSDDDGGISGAKLKQYIEQVEKLDEDKAAIAADIKDVFTVAKSDGFDTKIMRKIIAIRKLDKDEYDEQESLLAMYRRVLDMDG